MKYHFMIHKEDDGYWAECCELDGCKTQADTLDELYQECEEALNLYLEEAADSKLIFPLPDNLLNSNKNLIEISVEPEVALAVLLRHYRINNQLTQKQASEKLGMKNIYSYQRLEKRSNPTLTIMKRINTVFPEIKLERIFS